MRALRYSCLILPMGAIRYSCRIRLIPTYILQKKEDFWESLRRNGKTDMARSTRLVTNMARSTLLVILLMARSTQKRTDRRKWLDRLAVILIKNIYTLTLPSACYILYDESCIPFYSTSNGY